MPSDPFDEVRADVAAAVTEAEATLRQWRARHEEPTAKRLLADLESIEIDLADMDSAIESATLHPERFHISESTLAERRKFMRKTRSTVAAAREEVGRGKVSAGMAKAKGAPAEERIGLLAASPPGGSGGKPGGSGVGSNPSRRQKDMELGNAEVFGSHASLQQVRLCRPCLLESPMRRAAPLLSAGQAAGGPSHPSTSFPRLLPQVQHAEQEETLNQLGSAVGRLKQLGGAMNAELASQNAMLNDLDSGAPCLRRGCGCQLRSTFAVACCGRR